MKMTTEESLRMEVEVLKMERAQLLRGMYAEKGEQAGKDEQAAVAALAALRTELSEKYGIPAEQIRVSKDGTIHDIGKQQDNAQLPANGASA